MTSPTERFADLADPNDRELASGQITPQQAADDTARATAKSGYFVATPVRNLTILQA